MTMDSSDGIRTVVLRRSSDGLGFSIMGGAGFEFPPVIYGIEKDSPAARSGLVSWNFIKSVSFKYKIYTIFHSLIAYLPGTRPIRDILRMLNTKLIN